MKAKVKNVAVVLCGSGFKDGSEIRESVATLWALSLQKAVVQCFAPNLPQHDVINCLTMEPEVREKRNMLVESARIARGEILSLDRLDTSQIDAIIIPGGFGVAKNLCTFALKGAKGTVLPELERVLVQLHKLGKPIGAVCIAPAVIALALKDKKLELTLGPASEAAGEIEKLGHRHVVTQPDQCHVDSKNLIATTGAYMFDDAPLDLIFEGIRKHVEAVLELS